MPKKKRKHILDLRVGDEVYWNDPDNGRCSRFDKIAEICGEPGDLQDDDIVILESGTEVFAHELT